MELLPEHEPVPTLKGRDLALFANSDREVFFFYITEAIDSLSRMHEKGIYDPHLALRSFQHVAKEAAIVYERAFGDEKAAEKRRITCFTPEEVEEAGHRLLLMNQEPLREAIRKVMRKESIL